MSNPESARERELDPETLPEVDPGYGEAQGGDAQDGDQHLPPDVDDDNIVSPGSTATGSGTSDPAEIGTTEADVSDGSEQKQPRVD